MRALTGKQESFAQAVAGGSTLAHAYRSSYTLKSMSTKQTHTEASRLAHHPVVARRIEELRAPIVGKIVAELAIDRLWITKRLVDTVETGMACGNLSAAIRALELLGKDLGMFVDRRTDVPTDPLDEFTREQLKELKKVLEEELARRRGAG